MAITKQGAASRLVAGLAGDWLRLRLQHDVANHGVGEAVGGLGRGGRGLLHGHYAIDASNRLVLILGVLLRHEESTQ